MIQVCNEPTLLDFLVVCEKMPAEERSQLERFTGMEYTIDGAAVGNYTAPGPKWVFKTEDGFPLLCGGFVMQRPGVWRDFMITTPEAFGPKYWFACTRAARKIMDFMLVAHAHRLECVAPASREAAIKWYRIMGYTQEAPLRKYCADGSDAISFVRVRE